MAAEYANRPYAVIDNRNSRLPKIAFIAKVGELPIREGALADGRYEVVVADYGPESTMPLVRRVWAVYQSYRPGWEVGTGHRW